MPKSQIFTMANMSFNAICENKFLAKISEFTVSCQLRKICCLLLPSRCKQNYRKTCSFLHDNFTETVNIMGPRSETTFLQEFANKEGADQPLQSDQHLCYSIVGKYHI